MATNDMQLSVGETRRFANLPPMTWSIRNALLSEFGKVGQLMVNVYAALDGFPKPDEQPAYYNLLANVGELTHKPATELLVAVSGDTLGGAVVYFGDMKYYGSGGMATQERNASGFRLLAVDPATRGQGVGRLLINACIEKAIAAGNAQVIIHTTRAMQTAWTIYETLGFQRSTDLDFVQGNLEVFGFRLRLHARN